MRPAKTPDSIANWPIRKQKKKDDQAKVKGRKKAKKFHQLSDNEKDDILKDLAIRFGYIEED